MPGDGRRASLLVLSLPRSLSTFTFDVCRRVLELEAPRWTTDGEILNLDRHVLAGRPRDDEFLKYATPGGRPEQFEAIGAFVSDVVQARGRCYKDVVQPFAMRAWLHAQAAAGPPAVRVLKIRGDVAHVACRMWRRGWTYPRAAAPSGLPPFEGLVHGLAMAERAIRDTPGAEVSFGDLMSDEGGLWAALDALYPEGGFARPRYIDAAFRTRRAQMAASDDPRLRQDASNLLTAFAAESPRRAPLR